MYTPCDIYQVEIYLIVHARSDPTQVLSNVRLSKDYSLSKEKIMSYNLNKQFYHLFYLYLYTSHLLVFWFVRLCPSKLIYTDVRSLRLYHPHKTGFITSLRGPLSQKKKKILTKVVLEFLFYHVTWYFRRKKTFLRSRKLVRRRKNIQSMMYLCTSRWRKFAFLSVLFLFLSFVESVDKTYGRNHFLCIP